MSFLRKSFAYILLGNLFFVSVVLGQKPQELFSEANNLYKKGEYSKAVALYEKTVTMEPESYVLYYNLANAYFKAGRVGKAIQHYEKARRLAPRDAEVCQNLSYVQNLIEYKIDDKRNWYWIQLGKALSYLKGEEVLLLSLIFYFIFLCSYALDVWLRKTFVPNFGSKLLLLVFGVSLVLCVAKYDLDRARKEAVVTEKELEVRYGPSRQDRVAFRLAEGLKAQIVRQREGWVLIHLVNGQNGWCEMRGLGLI